MSSELLKTFARLPLPAKIAWLCALAPFFPILVILFAAAQQYSESSIPLGPLEDKLQATKQLTSHIAWSLTAMFAAYVAGPLWLLSSWLGRLQFSWKQGFIQISTFVVGWLLFWLLLVHWELLSKVS